MFKTTVFTLSLITMGTVGYADTDASLETLLFTPHQTVVTGWANEDEKNPTQCTVYFQNHRPVPKEIRTIRVSAQRNEINIKFNIHVTKGEAVLSSRLSDDRQQVEFLTNEETRVIITSIPTFTDGAFSWENKQFREITVEVLKKGLLAKDHYRCRAKISPELLYGE